MVRRALRTREVGHAGTLDPMATGVLVVAVGEATKLVPYLTDARKTYEARLELGRETDTLDALGQVVTEVPPDDELLALLSGVPAPLPARMASAVAAELGRTSQDPPIYSAIQQDGERAYARARRGEAVVLSPRPVLVHTLEITGFTATPGPTLDVRVTADKGYYVRALGRDLARHLGTVGHLSALRRIASGGFTVEQAVTFPAARESLEQRMIPLAVAARQALPAAELSEAGVVDARCGRRVRPEDFLGTPPRGEASAWFDPSGGLVAVGVIEDSGRVIRGFAPESR